jgi:hypothetical protein
MSWRDELFEDIEDSFKEVKFSTHKNKRVFMGKLKATINEYVDKNTTEKQVMGSRHDGLTLTRPNPNPSHGASVMTQRMSEKGDDVLKQHAAVNNPYRR